MITADRKGKFKVGLSNGQHEIVSDLAKDLGGDDLGLNPHELVEAALASCTSQTLIMYASRKGIELPELSVEVTIVKEGTESLIERKIYFGNFTQEEKDKFITIANKCPIHKLLSSTIKIETYEK